MKKLLSIVTLFCWIINAQDFKGPSITPPSPTAYELGKYGNASVGLFTGTPNINIPIYNYQAGTLSVPISLSYSSNGIQVNQLSSNVGLGWSLNAGGVITRITRGKPDDIEEKKYARNDIANMDLYTPTAAEYFYTAAKDNIDTETDMFMYNFQGYTGKFVYNSKGNIICIPKNNLNIVRYAKDNSTGFKIITPDGTEYLFYDKEESSTKHGSNPIEDSYVSSWFLSKIIAKNQNIITFNYSSQGYNYTTSKTQNITFANPDNQYVCNSNYSKYVKSIEAPTDNRLYIMGKKLDKITSNLPSFGEINFEYNEAHPSVSGYGLVTNINVSINNNVIENYNLKYLKTNNNRVFLESLTEKDITKKTSFDYIKPEKLAKRLVPGVDHYGYSNGASAGDYFANLSSLNLDSNSNIPGILNNYRYRGVNKVFNPNYAINGLLQKIVYPTKGHTLIQYETNNASVKKTKQVSQNKTLLSFHSYWNANDDNDDGPNNDDPKFYTFNKDTNILIEGSAEVYCDGPKETQARGSLTITDQNNQMVSIGGGFSDNNAPQKYYITLKKDYTYEFRLSAGPCSTTRASVIELNPPKTVAYYEKTDLGGFRVKRLIKNDNIKNDTIRYYYGAKENHGTSSGSVMLPKKPNYFSKRVEKIECQQPLSNIQFLELTQINSNPTSPLFRTTKYTTPYYKYVTISHGGDHFENGGEEHKFYIDLNGDEYPNYLLTIGSMSNLPWVNKDWQTGLLESKTFFKVSSYNKDMDSYNITPVKKETFNYFEDSNLKDEVYGHALAVNYPVEYTGSITYQCTEEDKTKTFKNHTCTNTSSNHNHIWAAIPFDGIDGWRCIARNSNNTLVVTKHACNNQNGVNTLTYYHKLDNLSIARYKTISYWYYMNSKTETVYDENGQNPITTTTNYKYDNPLHLQPTEVTVNTTNDNKTVKTKTYYPDDVTTASALGTPALSGSEYNAIHKLKAPTVNNQSALHQIAQPVQTVTTVTNNGVSTKQTQRTSFLQKNNMVLPEFVKTLKGNYSSANPLQTRMVYHAYDNKGNPLEVSKLNNSHTVYIWGYNSTYPVAKIENATYNEVSSYVTAIQNASNADNDRTIGLYSGNEGVLRRELNKLRTNLKQAMVTTYTYDPLIGVTSVTDPKGYTIYYHYDNFNRLEFVKDQDGNIITDHKYNYATN